MYLLLLSRMSLHHGFGWKSAVPVGRGSAALIAGDLIVPQGRKYSQDLR